MNPLDLTLCTNPDCFEIVVSDDKAKPDMCDECKYLRQRAVRRRLGVLVALITFFCSLFIPSPKSPGEASRAIPHELSIGSSLFIPSPKSPGEASRAIPHELSIGSSLHKKPADLVVGTTTLIYDSTGPLDLEDRCWCNCESPSSRSFQVNSTHGDTP